MLRIGANAPVVRISATLEGVTIVECLERDQIYGSYGGRFVPVDAAGNVSVHGTWTIEGGTGRFAGATGGGPAGGLATAAGGTVILDGTPSSVGSAGA